MHTTTSPSSDSLVVPPTRLCTVGNHAFPVSAARVWNGLHRHTSHPRHRYTYSSAILRHSFSPEVFPPPLRNRHNYHHCTCVHVYNVLLLLLCVPWPIVANFPPYATLIIFVYLVSNSTLVYVLFMHTL